MHMNVGIWFFSLVLFMSCLLCSTSAAFASVPRLATNYVCFSVSFLSPALLTTLLEHSEFIAFFVCLACLQECFVCLFVCFSSLKCIALCATLSSIRYFPLYCCYSWIRSICINMVSPEVVCSCLLVCLQPQPKPLSRS